MHSPRHLHRAVERLKPWMRRLGHHFAGRLGGAPGGLLPVQRVPDALAPRDVVIIQPSGIRNRARVLKVARSILESGRSVTFFSKLPVGTSFDDVLVEHVLGCPVLYFPDAHDFLKAARTKVPALNWSLMVQYLRTSMWHYVRVIRPRVIHTFNTPAIGIGHDFRDRLRAEGLAVSWFHDFQEYAAGHSFRDDRVPDSLPDEEWRQTVLRHEADHAAHPDHSFTVSPALAEALVRDYGLVRAPTILLNVPRAADFNPRYRPTVRMLLNLPQQVPLFVYSGGATPLRGLHTLIAALGRMPQAHVALITQANSVYIKSLLASARENGYADRLHLLPYIEPHLLPSFLQDATAGVHPLVRYGNAEVALPNKLFDYLHARIPLVVSDAQSMAAFVNAHNIGEVFCAEDADSLAEALRRAAERRAEVANRLAVDGHLLAENAWEAQEQALLAPYEASEERTALRKKHF